MARGCLLGVVYLGVLFAGYFYVLGPRVEWPGNAFLSGFGALFTLLFFSGLLGVFRAHRDARRLRDAATHAVSTFEDGETVAVAGTIRALGTPLTAPFSGTACVAYDYDIHHIGRRASKDGNETYEAYDIAGIALTPAIIDTPTGGVRLLSFAMLEEFPRQMHNSSTARQRARQWIASTTFKPMSVVKVFSAFSALSEALTDEDGSVRMDWRMTQGEIVLDTSTIRERLLVPGQQVSAVGRYNAERRGLMAEGMTSLIQLRPGDAATAQKALLRKAWAGFAFGVVFFVICHAFIVGVFYASETRFRRVPPAQQESALREAVQKHDAGEVQRVVHQGVDVNVRGSHGDTMLHDLRDAEMVRVLIRLGADPNLRNEYGTTPLMLAAHMGLTDVVTALLEQGAQPNLARTDGSTALSEAMSGNQAEVVSLLQQHGATSDLLTAATGEPLPKDGGEPMATVRAYLRAVHARDMQGLHAAFINRPADFFADTDFDLWHRIRPEAPVFASGFTTDRAATLTIGGSTIANWPITWHYQVVLVGDAWKIAREWETDEASQGEPAKTAAPAAPAEPVERPRRR
jgi:hypothetical protein